MSVNPTLVTITRAFCGTVCVTVALLLLWPDSFSLGPRELIWPIRILLSALLTACGVVTILKA